MKKQTKLINVLVEKDVYEAIQKIAFDDERTVSNFIRLLIKKELNKRRIK